MPAIKLKKVTAEYLAEKEKAAEKEKEKNKKNLEEVAEGEEEEEEEEEVKSYNFLDVEVLWDKRKRTLPAPEQKLVEWLDANLESKTDVYLPLMTLYEYYSEVCQMQGSLVVDVPVFNRYIKDKFGKFFGFQENSPYRVLIKERKAKEKKPKVEGEGGQLKMRDIIREVIENAGNPQKGLRFSVISKAIMQKYPAHKIGLTSKKLKSALERGIYFRHVELVRGVGMCGYYRLPGPPTKEEEPVKLKEEPKSDDDENKESVENGEGEVGDVEGGATEEGATKRKAEDQEESTEASPKKKQKKKPTKKKKKPAERAYRSEASRHSDPQKVEDAFPLAITYQSDPKECSTSKIRHYISKFYRVEVTQERLKKAMETGVEKGLWELTKGNSMNGTYHLLIESFNPARSDNLSDQIAQALVACHEPKSASGGLIKKYITQYHPKLNIDMRPHLFKHALERCIKKGTIRQLSGVGASGSFQLVYEFFPSPAILAGDTSDDEEEEAVEYEDEDEAAMEYVPRPTKRGRIAQRKKETSSAPSSQRGRSAPASSKKGNTKGKAAPAKAVKRGKTVSYSESEDDDNDEEMIVEEYTPRKSKSRGGGAVGTPRSESKKSSSKSKKPAAKPSSAKKTKSPVTGGKNVKKGSKKSGGKGSKSASKPSGKSKASSPKKSPAKRIVVEDSDVDDEPISDQEEYVPKPSKRRGGAMAMQDESPPKKSKSKRR